jgi:hypothetical protein
MQYSPLDNVAPPNGGGATPAGPEPGSIASDEREDELHVALTGRDLSRSEVTLSEDEERELVELIIRDFNDTESENGEMKRNHIAFVDAWRGTAEAKDFPYEGAANTRSPIASAWFEQSKARYLKALLGRVTFSAVDGMSVDQKTLDELRDWFNYELLNVVKINKRMNAVLHYLHMHGTALPMPMYEREVGRLSTIEEFEYDETRSLSEQIETALTSLFSNMDATIEDEPEPGKFKISYRLPNDPVERQATVEFSLEYEYLYAKYDRDDVIFDGVRVVVPKFDDLVVPNDGDSVDEIRFFGHRGWISRYELERGIAAEPPRFRGLSEEDWERCTDASGTKSAEVVTQATTEHLDELEGTQTVNLPADHPSRQYLEMYRWEGWWPLNDGLPVQLAVWVLVKARRVIKVCRIEDLNRDGCRTPVDFRYIHEPGRFHGIGFQQWMQHQVAVMDGIVNQRLDAGFITNVPYFFYEPAAGMPAEMIRVKPGTGYPVKQVDKILFPKSTFQSPWSFQEQALARRDAQEQAGLSESAVGSYPTKRLSASEWVGTQGSVDIRTEQIVLQLAEAYKVLLTRIFTLYQQHMPDGRVYEVSGESGEKIVRQLKRDRLHGKYILSVDSNVEQLVAETEKQNAQVMFAILTNPMLVQLGISGPDTIYEATKRLADVLKYKNVIIHRPSMPPMSDDPDVEHKKMARGEPVRPSLNEDHQHHMQQHAAFSSHPQLDAFMPDEGQQLLAMHMRETQEMAMQAQVFRAQQAKAAEGMQGTLSQLGVQPAGIGGAQPGNQAAPGTEAEGVAGPTG